VLVLKREIIALRAQLILANRASVSNTQKAELPDPPPKRTRVAEADQPADQQHCARRAHPIAALLIAEAHLWAEEINNLDLQQVHRGASVVSDMLRDNTFSTDRVAHTFRALLQCSQSSVLCNDGEIMHPPSPSELELHRTLLCAIHAILRAVHSKASGMLVRGDHSCRISQSLVAAIYAAVITDMEHISVSLTQAFHMIGKPKLSHHCSSASRRSSQSTNLMLALRTFLRGKPVIRS